ncbi:MAG: hypothetical protein RL172_2129 [Bacteroidota bacterium]
MARTVSDIKKEMTDVFVANTNVQAAYGLTPGKTFEEEFSVASIESILFYCLAFGLFVIYSFFDLFKKEIDQQIIDYTHPTLLLFANKMRLFQFGDMLIAETDKYDNTGLTDAQITARRVIKYSSAVEQDFTNGRFGIRMKVAGEDAGGNRIALPAPELTAARAYAKRFMPPGTYHEVTSTNADYLKLVLRVYYNPLVLNNQGQRLDGTVTDPLQDAIKEHLKNLPFNGRFNLTALADAMQEVEGINDPRIISAQTKYGLLPYADVADEIIPDSGYLKIYDPLTELTINWIASV